MDGKKRKVMFLIYSLCGGGAERVLVETVNRLPKDRYDVTLMTLFHDDTRAGMLSPEVHYRPALRVKNGRAQKILSGIMQYIIPPKWLYRWFFRSDADVEVAFMEAFPTKILAYSTNQHAKKYAWVHIDVQTYTKQDRLFRSMRHQKACYERFDGIYCVSENVQEAFSAKFGLTERVHVAYNMLDEQAIRRRKDEPVDDIPKGEFLMVSVGSLIPRKGFERLIHVCGLLKSRGYHFHLLILGKGELYEDLAEQVIDEHLQDSVQLLGFRDNPYPYMAAADLYVCPSYVEGFSTVVSEAVVLETPVVTTDCSGMREILGELIKYEAAALCAGVLKVTNPRYRHVWLVSERGREARDNGYHYFAYLRQAHPEINAVYVADPKLPDYDRVAQLGSVVPYRSWRHYLLCAASEMKVSTHVSGYTPDIERYYMLDKLHIVRGKKVFLQHGIMIDDMKWYHYPNVVMDLFVTTLQKERDFVESAFGYPKGVVRRLGLCRYDALLHPHETKRQVLFMPTWRTYAVEGKTQAEFEQTDYFQHWQAVISDPKLEKLLTKYGYDAVFYPHFEVQRFLSAFHTENPHVKIGALGQMDVQTLLMESALLITDFSSIQFDFAYMLKPEIYYQFDEARYWGTHHDRGYFDYRVDGFGEVVTTQEALLQAIETALASECAVTPEMQKHIRDTFGALDDHNCERNHQAIRELMS